MRTATRVCFTSIVVGIAAGCLGCSFDGPRDSGTTVRDSAGITIVVNDHARPAWGDDPWRMSDAPVLRIGALDSEGPDQLYRVVSSRRLADGRIPVVNTGTAEVRVFDHRGPYIRTLGGRGDGPGEFQSPWAVYPLAGDSLMVLDLYRAVSVFDSSGTYVRQFVPGGISGERQGSLVGQFADGTLLLRRSVPGQSGRTGLGRSMVTMVRIGLDGTVLSTFGDFEDQEVMFGSGGGWYLFGAWAHQAAADSTMWYGPGDRFELREVSRDGSTVRLVRLDLPSVQVTEAAVDEYRESVRERVRGTREEQSMNRILADVQYPDVFPAHFEVMVDDVGNLWVQDYQPFQLPRDRTWYIFDPAGSYLGSMIIPAAFTMHQIGDSFILGKWIDELEVEYIHMYALEKPQEG